MQVALDYYEAFNKATQSGNGDPLRALSTPDCEACQMDADIVEKTKSRGGYYEGGEMKPVLDVPVDPVSSGDTATVTLVYKRQSGTYVKSKDAEPSNFDASKSKRIFSMKKEGGDWRITKIITEEYNG